MEIVEGIHQVDGVSANVYLVIDREKLILIDSGMPRNAGKILDYVRKINRQPSDIATILITHCHIDHIGSAHELKQLTNAKVGVHEQDADFVAGKKTPPTPKGIIGVLSRTFSFLLRSKPVEPDLRLKDSDKIGRLTVVHTPGHTLGSISLYDPTGKVIFVGDALRFVDGNITSPRGRFTLDPQQAMESIARISRLDFEVMLSGHGDPLKPKASDKVKEFCGSLKSTRTRKNITKEYTEEESLRLKEP